MVRFHVVNSVKGGCGKSTFSLYLANYLTAQKHKVVIIDLDIGGSTWYRDFKPYLVSEMEKSDENNKDVDFSIEDTKFLNDLFYEYEKNKTRKHIFELQITDAIIKQIPDEDNQEIEGKGKGNQTTEHKIQPAEGEVQETWNKNQTVEGKKTKYEIIEGEKRTLNVIMTDPKRASCIRDEELDLLEEAICSLVDEIATNTYPFDSKKIVDFVFDMPPGYEEHSEHILMHALMDLGSNLYKKYTSKKTKNGELQNPVYLYMISGVKQASLKANIQYVERFYKKPSYSMNTGVLKTENVFFLFNDVDMSFQAFVDTLQGAVPLKTARKRLTNNISETESINGDNIQFGIINHIPFLLSNQGYKDIITSKDEENPPKYYMLVEAEGGFHDFLESAKHLAE